MKRSLPSPALVAVALLASLALLAGCAKKTGITRAERTAESMEAVETDYREVPKQIDATRAALENLVRPGQTDLKAAYSAYAENVDKMEKLSERVARRSEQMRSRGNAYFEEWDRSYTSPSIREISEQRRVEIRRLYSQIPEASIGVTGALNAYMRDIRDIRTFLSNDLTPTGVERIRPIAHQAAEDGEIVKQRIQPVTETIQQVRQQLAPGEPPTGTGRTP